MMDLREIIKWFIPCFHILLVKKVKMFSYLTHICLFLLFFARPSFGANVDISTSPTSVTKNVVNDNFNYLHVDSKNNNQSVIGNNLEESGARGLPDASVGARGNWLKLGWQFLLGRTFGRPFKKMVAALIPLIFQIGAASTWAVVAAIVGVKTLMVALVILKILLIAGAAKVGALFGQKTQHHGWEPPHPHSPQKEIHLHIHNGHPSVHEEHVPVSAWSRDGTIPAASDSKTINLVVNPYAGANLGPQTISTPYGSYIRVDSPQTKHTIDLASLQAGLVS